MTLTTEQIREILDGAPLESHNRVVDVIININDHLETHYHERSSRSPMRNYGTDWHVVSVDFLREILTLRQRIEELEAQQSEVAARAVEGFKREVRRSIGNMEYAAFNLCENMNLDSKHGGRIIETTCPEKSLLIAIRDLKELREQGDE